ncbi:MAG: hypothetical protein OJF50_004035 [Nitrospira sp.]|nr:hypothetical protein [Nitrospira sp.]
MFSEKTTIRGNPEASRAENIRFADSTQLISFRTLRFSWDN